MARSRRRAARDRARRTDGNANSVEAQQIVDAGVQRVDLTRSSRDAGVVTRVVLACRDAVPAARPDRRPGRIGACADTGHWATSGITPLDGIKLLKGRIISLHLKERPVIGKQMPDMVYGEGVSNIKGILDELKRQGFDGHISIEYENNWDHSVPDVAQCIGFVRGYSAAAQKRVD